MSDSLFIAVNRMCAIFHVLPAAIADNVIHPNSFIGTRSSHQLHHFHNTLSNTVIQASLLTYYTFIIVTTVKLASFPLSNTPLFM
jgi:hypothetical protein